MVVVGVRVVQSSSGLCWEMTKEYLMGVIDLLWFPIQFVSLTEFMLRNEIL